MTDLSKKVKIALLTREKNQCWLIEQVKKETGLYFDYGYLSRILSEKSKNPRIVGAIKKILNI